MLQKRGRIYFLEPESRKGDRFISSLKFQKKVIEKKEKRTSYFRMNPSWLAGVDGFRSEWFVVLVNHAQGHVIETRHHVCGSFKEVLNLTPAPKVIAIDIPIGLLDTPEIGGRIKTNMKIVGFA